MQINATFLALAKESFKNKETGEQVIYYRLHLWDKSKSEYMKLPIRADAAEACIADDTKFGDDVSLEATFEPSREKDPVRIIKW